MLHKTPPRLFALDESPPEEDEQSATPISEMTEHEAITRKIPDAVLAALEAPPETERRLPSWFPNWRSVVPAAGVAVVVGFFVVALLMNRKGTATQTSVVPHGTSAPAREASPQPSPAVVPRAPVAASTSEGKAAPEVVRVEVIADPVDAELSLDGNVVAKGRLKLEVPLDRGIHVVSASAPGYVPFNQRVSFAGDVLLNVKLRRGQTIPARPTARPRPSHVEPRHKTEIKPAVVPSVPRTEPGMNLEGPSLRPSAAPIDEGNPYKP